VNALSLHQFILGVGERLRTVRQLVHQTGPTQAGHGAAQIGLNHSHLNKRRDDIVILRAVFDGDQGVTIAECAAEANASSETPKHVSILESTVWAVLAAIDDGFNHDATVAVAQELKTHKDAAPREVSGHVAIPFSNEMISIGAALSRNAKQNVSTPPFGLGLASPALLRECRWRLDESITGDARFNKPARVTIRASRLQLRPGAL
jgi:hypothetical protein